MPQKKYEKPAHRKLYTPGAKAAPKKSSTYKSTGSKSTAAANKKRAASSSPYKGMSRAEAAKAAYKKRMAQNKKNKPKKK
jgi:hypothetical protein